MDRVSVFVWQFQEALIFDLSEWQQNHNTTTDKKTANSAFILTTFRGDFVSKPMTLQEIDQVIFCRGAYVDIFRQWIKAGGSRSYICAPWQLPE